MKTLDEIVGDGRPAGEPDDEAMTADVPEAAPEGHEGADDDAASPEDEARDRMVPVGALIDERRKRRAAEDRLARRGQDGEATGTAGLRNDPEGHLAALRAELAGEIAAVRVDAAEAAARARHPDFGRKAAAFAAVARGEPALLAAMQAAPDPAEFAYRLGARVLAGGAGEAALPESLSDSPSAAGPAARPWRPKPLSDIVGRR